MDIIGYIRMYKAEEDDYQRQELEDYGCTRIFRDYLIGKTAREDTELGQMLESLKTNDLVVVTRLDRLSRTLIDLFKIIGIINRKGAHFHSLAERLDTRKPGGEMIFQSIDALAEFEVARVRERTRKGWNQARARGQKVGRPPKLHRRQRDLVQRMHDEGDSLREIARTLGVSVGTVTRALNVVSPASD